MTSPLKIKENKPFTESYLINYKFIAISKSQELNLKLPLTVFTELPESAIKLFNEESYIMSELSKFKINIGYFTFFNNLRLLMFFNKNYINNIPILLNMSLYIHYISSHKVHYKSCR